VEVPWVRAWLFSSMGLAERSQKARRLAYLEEALALFRKINDTWGICETLGRLALTWLDLGEYERAGELLDEEINLVRQAGDKSVLSFALCVSACNDWYWSKIDQQTESKYQEALELFRELRYKGGTVWALLGLGQVASVRGDHERARRFFEQSLSRAQQLGSKGWMLDCLVGLANIFCTHNEVERAARILAAMDAPFQAVFSHSTITYEIDRQNYERILAAVRAQLDEDKFTAAFAEGQRMTLDQAASHALENTTRMEAE
jgi:tetratricopeptide (TPR) repeat protein